MGWRVGRGTTMKGEKVCCLLPPMPLQRLRAELWAPPFSTSWRDTYGFPRDWSVLVSAGIELIFFLVAGTVLCFGFSVRILLITC